ncbi:tyrosine phosphatase [Yersinia enterocolitica]|uniref:protein-tyrosine phosphatase family protein n=1 Tax=Yersinia enterocolitica TaxID=630 RepID=UPI00065A915E|nr:protein-tyrosine phosphatase family protein [Yersinia enterocolitica]CRY16808.1 tyrosine phosphatase [Yersinia enterocolitica]
MLTKNIAPTPEMVKIVTSVLDNKIKLQQIDFNGKKYTISIDNGKCVSLTRDDKKWYKSVCDFFSRGLTSGQSAFTPRAYQLKMAVDEVLILNKKEPIHMSLKEVNASVITKVEDKINSETDILWENLLKFNNENQYLSTLGDTNRYRDIKARISTQLNENLSANKISIAENHIANAGQYPKDEQIGDHLKMLADNKTSCLVVLASNEDIAKSKFTDYFTTHSSYATSELVGKKYNLSSDVLADSYVLKTKDSKGKYIDIPVFHVTNWPDKKPIPSSALIEMADLVTKSAKINNKINKISVNSFDKGLPFVHCKAGVGRTGTFIAEYYMSNHPDNNVSLERIIEDMRTSRNNHMVQKIEQLDTLVEICKAQNRPIFKSDEKLNLSVPKPIYVNIIKK